MQKVLYFRLAIYHKTAKQNLRERNNFNHNSEAGKITIKIQQTIIHNKLSFDVFEMYWQLKTQLKRME